MEKVITLDEVMLFYQDLLVFEDVTMEVHRGEFLAIIGPNGCGKTSLIKLMLGLIRPDAGMVRVFGQDPTKMNHERSRLGYVPQIKSIDITFPIDVFSAVLMGRYGQIGLVRRPSTQDKKLAQEAMERVGISDLAKRPIARLSGGQRQRVFLARALANEPEILFLDEPTTGVDVATSEDLYETLERLRDDGVTIIIASHDVGVVANYVDQVACLNRRIVVHGRPDEVLGSKELTEMYGCHVAFFHHGASPHISVERHDE